MSFKDLSFAEETVLKGLLGFGSTSEVLSAGFVKGDLSKFHGNYVRFRDAWNRLDEGQQQAICDIWEKCNIGNHDSNIGRSTIPTIDTFIIEFSKWVERGELESIEQQWFDANPHYKEDYPPEDIMQQHKNEVSRLLLKHA